MIRIKPRRCGYGGEKGYTCQRLPQLQDWMFNEEIPFIAQMKAEFNKLPLRVKGMVYTEETIDMGWSEFGPHPEVPELTCRSNTDPASDATDVSVWGATGIPVEVGNATAYPVYGGSSGWLDLFNSGYEITGGTQYFYHNVSGTAAATSDVYIKVTGVDHEYHDIYLVGNIPTFKNGEQEMEMGPGLLEPMLDTDFAPVGIDTIPAWEAGLDADIFTNIVLNAWKGVIDDRIRNIYWRLNNMPIPSGIDENLLDLLDDNYSSTDCTNFRITLVSGNSLQKVGETPVTNTYAVSGGNIYINDEYIEVAGIALVQSEVPFKVWLQIYKLSEPDPETGNTWAALLSTGPSVPTDPGRYAIGGVEVVQASTSTGAYILYKVFQEDCLSNIAVDEDAQTGLHGVIQSDTEGGETIVSIPGSTLEPAAGILQPAVNIWLNDPRSESVQDVPTVEAVYNFVHGITAYNGPVADAKATEKSVSNTEGSTVYSQVTAGSVITITKDRADQNTQETLYNLQTADTQLQAAQADYSTASTNYNTAKSNYDSAKAAWEEAGSPSSGAEYNAYQAAQTALSTAETALDTATSTLATKQTAYDTAYGNVYGVVTAGTPGTVYTIDGIVISDSSILGGSSSVPTAYGVWTFVHDIYALATVGSVNTSVTPHTHSQGTPGTVFTIDVLDKEIYDAGKYLQDEVPTVKAVMDYVEGRPCQSSVAGLIAVSAGTESLASVHGTTATAGIVQSVKNIDIGTQDPNAVSPTAVPTVEAVYNFIHGTTITGYDVADAKADIVGSTITSAGSTAAALVAGAKPGTFFVTDDFTILGGTVTDYNDPQAVPTALAVYTYVAGYVSSYLSAYTAKAGYIKINSTTGKESLYSAANLTYQAGCVYTVMNVNMTSPGTKREISEHTVPTVEAIINYIHQNKTYHYIVDGTHYTATLDIEDSKATPTAMTINSPGTASESVSHTGTPGTAQVTTNIVCVTGTTSTATGCVVPTAQAVVDYVQLHGGSTALAVVGSFTATASAETWVDGSTASEGIFKVVKDVKMATTDSDAARSISRTSVPTVEAVYLFVSGYTATVGSFTATSSAETWVSGSTAISGITKVVSNIAMASTDTAAARSISKTAVPTVEAVKKYVDDHVYTGPFAVEATGTGTNVKIKEGKAYFGTTVFTYVGIASTAMANSATLYAECTKGSSTITIVTTDTTGATVACFPIASKDASGNITQRQWGDINIMGRWM